MNKRWKIDYIYLKFSITVGFNTIAYKKYYKLGKKKPFLNKTVVKKCCRNLLELAPVRLSSVLWHSEAQMQNKKNATCLPSLV